MAFEIVISYPVGNNQVGYHFCETARQSKAFIDEHTGAHIVSDPEEIQRAKLAKTDSGKAETLPQLPGKITAVLVRYKDMKNPSRLAVGHPLNPFTVDEIARLTRGVNTYALTADGDHLYLWGK